MPQPLYGQAALLAAEKARTGADPADAWESATRAVFPHSSESQRKGCPRGTFLGLCEAGLVRGVPAALGAVQSLNGGYAVRAVELLREDPALAARQAELWRRACGSDSKKHNGQMHVVQALWEAGAISR